MTKKLSSLKKRVITAAILAPIVLSITYFAPSNIFALMMLVFLVLGAYEWCNLSNLASAFAKTPYIILLAALFMGAYINLDGQALRWLFCFSVLCWLLIFIWLLLKQSFVQSTSSKPDYLKLLQGVFILVPAVLAMTLLHQAYGPMMIFYLFLIIWGADIGAYFTGKKFGQHKLAAKLSPGKTIEGVVGGLVLVLVMSAFVGSMIFLEAYKVIVFIVISLFVAAFSIVGDLYESMLKREAGVKDSSQLLPGHGGVLDRIDSLLAAAPLFLFFYVLAFGGS